MHDAIFENQGWLDLPLLLSLAGILGLSDRRLSGRVCDDSYRLLPLEQKAPKIDDRHGQLAPTAPSYCVGLVLPYRLALDWKVLQLAPAFWGQRAPVTQTKIQEVIMNRTDREIEGYVKDELQWSPDLDSGDVAVSVKQGVVTLTGFVRSYLDKYEAEAAAKRVAGVTAVANDIEVRLPGVDQRPDPEIARDAVASIKTQLPVSWEQIKVVVKDGWMTLEGEVEWQYQRVTAEQAVRGVKGVRGVSNLIKLKPRVQPSELKKKIQEAFRRGAEVDANRIIVEANGGEVILKGTVRSWIERKEAERVAWAAPGVTKVDDRIIVSP
jgi:osmotically-inducible protein OsmY